MEHLFSFNVKCPHCGKVLTDPYHKINDKPSIRLKGKTATGEEGTIRLCAIYGCHDHETKLDIKEKEIVAFFCPHCDASLTSKEECEECSAPMLSLKVIKGGKVIFCSRKDCTKQYIAFEELSATLKQFYDEYGYGHQ